ncbi:proline dehydrogenase family protein [bacterium SCSIO 12741]|nr:proline dehydrogenase family protein [bacterium SCSIO 12741]
MSKVHTAPSFDDTAVAFKHKSNGELRLTWLVFYLMKRPSWVKLSTGMTLFALRLRLPIEGMIKATIFKQFCGGESIADASDTYNMLKANGIEAILDYSVEGQENEETFDHVRDELLRLIDNAKKNSKVPTTCMKVTGVARFALLEKVSADQELSDSEKQEYNRVVSRLDQLCKKAHNLGVKLYIDAEESWIQIAIDRLAEVMMQKYNGEQAIVYTTLQLYRHDKVAYLNELIEKAKNQSFKLGVKLVRGAYLEKENLRAAKMGYATPIQPNKESTDRDYNEALKRVVENINTVEVCAGTHNERSAAYLCELMAEKGLPNNHPSIFFSQLFGMSDNISFILANSGYNVSKYLPYGPVRYTMPYLIRRAEENTSVSGQMGKELQLVLNEMDRRKRS